ncbi:hypothetical protein [Dyadobacter sp. LHD-138]|nr:hypothetical protein [Dyadobacter sp. LHD-138]MDQ6477178.1 hypothetical protein [Dyadobacter sp. LHD-138]
MISITGATSGIGYALGEAFARDGARVILSDMDLHTETKAAC